MTTRSPRSPSGAASGAVRVIPPEASPEKRKAAVVETVRRVGLSPRSAALSVGVAASTFYDWMDLDESFREEIAVAERQFERSMLLVIVSSAVKTRSWRAAMAVLERRFPDLWTPRLNVAVEPMSLEDELDATLSDEQLDDRLRALVAEADQRLSKEEA